MPMSILNFASVLPEHAIEPAVGDGDLRYGQAHARASARVTVYDSHARLLRGLRDLLLCWLAAAVAAIALPFANLVLAPALLVAGVWLFGRELRTAVGLRGVRGVCPACHVEQDFRPVPGRLRAHTSLRCASCHRAVEFTLEPTSLKPEALAHG
jgi:hypothetical protein